MVKLPHTDAPTRTRAREQYGSVHGRARTMFVCDVPPLGRRPEHRIDRLTPIRPQMGRLLEHGVSADGLTRLHGSPLRPLPGRSVPTSEPSRLQGHCFNAHRTTVTTMMMMDKTMVDALAAYTGTVTVCPSGRGKAPDAKRQRGRAQFQCVCGHAGTMAYPKLFQRLRRGRRRGKPLRLRCQRCGRVLR